MTCRMSPLSEHIFVDIEVTFLFHTVDFQLDSRYGDTFLFLPYFRFYKAILHIVLEIDYGTCNVIH